MSEIVKLEIPKPLLAVPMQGEILPTPDGKGTIGVICGFGWITNDDKSPTMRPVVLVVVKGGAVVALPAEITNTVEPNDDGPRLVRPV